VTAAPAAPPGSRVPLRLAGQPSTAVSPLLAASLFLIAVAVGLAAGALSSVHPDDAIAWGALALAAACTALLLAAAALAEYPGLGLSVWRIGPWLLVWGGISFGLATLTWIGPQTGPPAEILPASVLSALWLTAVALTMLTAGYCAGPFRFVGRPAVRAANAVTSRFTDEIRRPTVPWVLFAVGLAAQAASAALTGHFGYVGDVASTVSSASGYGQYISILGECVPLAVAAASVRAYATRTSGAWLTLGILFTAACIAGAVAGGKQSFVVAILAVVIPRATSQRRLPAGPLVAAVLFFLLLVIPFNLAYRATARGGAVTLSTSQAVTAAPAVLREVAASDVSLTGLGQSAAFLAQRIQSIDSPAIIMQRTPAQIPYSSPAVLAEAPAVNLIPRIIWPGKPILAAGYLMSQQYFNLPPGIYTSSDVTPEGDLYRHGGWFTLVAGMFLLGSGIRILDDVTDLRASVHGAFLIILLFPEIVQAGSDWSGLVSGIPGMVLLWFGVTAFAFARRPGRAGDSGLTLPGAHVS
jgi:hypothetical protein